MSFLNKIITRKSFVVKYHIPCGNKNESKIQITSRIIFVVI